LLLLLLLLLRLLWLRLLLLLRLLVPRVGRLLLLRWLRPRAGHLAHRPRWRAALDAGRREGKGAVSKVDRHCRCRLLLPAVGEEREGGVISALLEALVRLALRSEGMMWHV